MECLVSTDHTSTELFLFICAANTLFKLCEMRYFILWVHFLVLLPHPSICNIQPTLSSPRSNSPRHLCHHQDATALLQFVRDFVIDSSASRGCVFLQTAYPKIRSWKDNTDCCSWDGISCDSLSGHVIELDLSCGQIRGTIDSTSTLFQLSSLQKLNLAFNSFFTSSISPKFGHFPHLNYLNLSSTMFYGKVPAEIAKLSRLTSLDLSQSYFPSLDYKLELPDLDLITKSMTKLTQLHLDNVFVNSVVPRSLVNLTSLSSLVLQNCGLHGNFPTDILHLPHLRDLIIEDDNLYGNFSGFNWTSPLEVLSLSSSHFTGKLPESPGPTQFLRKLRLSHSKFYGVLPSWVWNTTQEIDLSHNQFSGELPHLLDTSRISGITYIDLSLNMLSGKIPSWAFTLPSLVSLDLSDNQFSGQLLIEFVNISQTLWYLDLSTNMVHGSIPTSISGLKSLSYLYLHSNKLNGTVDFNGFYVLQSLNDLVLSNNNLSLSFSETSTLQPQFENLGLSSCNLERFPDFLIDQKYLHVLELSNNRIHGQVPQWFLEKDTLSVLDVSDNYLTGGLEHIPWKNLASVDLRSNMFNGPLPQLPHFIYSYLVSNNKFTGEIPSTICNLTNLQFLDLSNNSLTGRIPQCLGNVSDGLFVLNLRLNEFHGKLPQDFSKCRSLKGMDVNGNQLEGTIPPSLINCSSLEILDLGNNKLSGTFPHWLGTLPELEVLVLRSNRFEGFLTEPDDDQSPFLKLRILDIADNRFSGNLPRKLIKSLKAMMNEEERDEVQYMHEVFYNFRNYNYMDSIALTFKGSDHELDKVLLVLAAIDVSSNGFEGHIPDEIADLVSLRWLNLSQNNFSGTTPPSLSNLVVLESLDISSNELVGQIPKELASLTSLEYFNASRNQLVGPIPVGKQFDTFGNASYLDNPGLCGKPLSKKCGDGGGDATQPPRTDSEDDDSGDISVWEIVLIGYGSGMVIGLSIGYLMLWARTPLWLLRLICRVEVIIERRSKRRRRRQST